LIVRTIHDMAYDPGRDEITVGQIYALAILTFKGDATGDVAPIRKIMGPKTQLHDAQRVAVDPVHHEIFIPEGNDVLVFPQDADGDVAPIRILKGPDTQLGAATATVDPIHNLLIVSGGRPRVGGTGNGNLAQVNLAEMLIAERNGKPAKGSGPAWEANENGNSVGQIAIFDRTASGNTKPLRVITGDKTMLVFAQTLMTTYPPRGEILGAVWGSDYGEIDESSERAFVGVWSIDDNGNVPPRWTIGGPNGILRQARGVAVDPKHKTVIVSDKYINGVLSFDFPEIF